MARLISKLFRGPRRLVTDRLFPKYFASLDHKRGGRQLPPLNGQSGRTAIVESIIRDCGIEQIVETGTYRGSTTGWFVRFGLPIHTVEANARFAHFARLIFAGEPLIRTAESDSAAFLAELARDPQATARTTFFYLDAHWGRRLPLGEEIGIVTRAFPAAVMVVDDFQVPDDPDYGFDDYGPDKRLTLDYVRQTGVTGLKVFFPVLRGRDEDGARRGCVVLTANAALAERLGRNPLIRAYPAG